jgi:hypothetical protein
MIAYIICDIYIIDGILLHKFNCTRQLHESLSSVAGVQV